MKKFSLAYNIIVTLLGWLGTVISVLTVEWISVDSRITIIVFASVILSIYIYMQIKEHFNEYKNIVIHEEKDQVNKYLLNWLKSGGRTVIFTRDLTWADESIDIKNTLQNKARKNELIICLYKSTNTTDDLKRLGAEIYEHNLPDNRLKSRFTIVDYGSNNPRITVGTRLTDGKFQNERYSMVSNPNACQAFIELFEFVKSLNNPRQ